LPERPALLVVALSGRALAVAAKRAGYRVAAIDLFGDTDLRAAADDLAVVEGAPDTGFDQASLLAAVDKLASAESAPCIGLVYGTGLEAQPELIELLAESRRLYGNGPDTLRRVKDPREFFAALDRLGIAYPEIRFTLPADGRGWLSKKIGGSGGAHVMPVSAASDARDRYFQRLAAGRPVGISFLANGRRAFLVGVNEQWCNTDVPKLPYRFAGGLQPAAVSARLRRDLAELLDALTAEFGLIGLNSLDVLDNGQDYSVLEVNPRPGANLDLYDSSGTAALLAWHLAACEGRLPDKPLTLPPVSAMSIIYTASVCRVPADTDWPEWVADRPEPDACIAEGAPVCTVLASGATESFVRRTMARRVSALWARLEVAASAASQHGSVRALAEAGHV
jgi:predicted ATP-grasp superfamily ATP-dependent carboligase